MASKTLAIPSSSPLRIRCWLERRSLKTGTCLWEARPPTMEKTSPGTTTSSECSFWPVCVSLHVCVSVCVCVCVRGGSVNILTTESQTLAPPPTTTTPTHPFLIIAGQMSVCWIVNSHCRYQTRGGTRVGPTTNTKRPSWSFISTVLFLTFRSKKPDPVDLLSIDGAFQSHRRLFLPQRSVSIVLIKTCQSWVPSFTWIVGYRNSFW